MNVLATCTTPDDVDGARIDAWVMTRFGFASRKRVRKKLKAGEILLDGKPVETSRRLKPNQQIAILEGATPHPVYELPLTVHWADEHLAVIDKPPGLPVSGNRHRCVAHALPFNLPPSPELDRLVVPTPAHRLDVRTAGLLLVPRSHRAQVGLGRAFEHRRIKKRYRTLVAGRLQDGSSEAPIDGRPASTSWRVVEHTPSLHVGCVTTLDAFPTTGRTHQVRIHLAQAGAAVLGDDLHGTPPIMKGMGLFLFAAELHLDHPVTGDPLHFELPEPPKFGSYRRREARRVSAKGGLAGEGVGVPLREEDQQDP